MKVEIEDGEKLSVPALNWVKFHLTKEFVQILNDTVPGEVSVTGITPRSKDLSEARKEIPILLKYKISPLFSNRTIIDYLR